MDQLVCLGVPLVSVYKGSRGGVAGQEEGAPGGVLLPPGVGLPPLALVEKERGEGRVAHLWPPLLSSTKAH